MPSETVGPAESTSPAARDGSDVFISYPRVARDWKERLERDLVARGLRCFSDTQLRAGDLTLDELRAGLARSGALIAVWHPDAPENTQMLAEVDAFLRGASLVRLAVPREDGAAPAVAPDAGSDAD
jgi:hypothetical protein